MKKIILITSLLFCYICISCSNEVSNDSEQPGIQPAAPAPVTNPGPVSPYETYLDISKNSNYVMNIGDSIQLWTAYENGYSLQNSPCCSLSETNVLTAVTGGYFPLLVNTTDKSYPTTCTIHIRPDIPYLAVVPDENKSYMTKMINIGDTINFWSETVKRYDFGYNSTVPDCITEEYKRTGILTTTAVKHGSFSVREIQPDSSYKECIVSIKPNDSDKYLDITKTSTFTMKVGETIQLWSEAVNWYRFTEYPPAVSIYDDSAAMVNKTHSFTASKEGTGKLLMNTHYGEDYYCDFIITAAE